MNREIKYVRKRLEYFRELELEIACYRKQIEDSLKILEKEVKKCKKK